METGMIDKYTKPRGWLVALACSLVANILIALCILFAMEIKAGHTLKMDLYAQALSAFICLVTLTVVVKLRAKLLASATGIVSFNVAIFCLTIMLVIMSLHTFYLFLLDTSSHNLPLSSKIKTGAIAAVIALLTSIPLLSLLKVRSASEVRKDHDYF